MSIYFSVYKDNVVDEKFFHPGTFENQYGLRYVRLILNFRMFISEITYITGDPRHPLNGETFVHGSIADILDHIHNSDVLKTRISVLLMRSDSDNDDRIATELVKVVRQKDSRDNIAYIISCQNNKKYIEKYKSSFDESDIQEEVTVYSSIF